MSPSDKNDISYYCYRLRNHESDDTDRRLQINLINFFMRLHRNSQKRFYQENSIYFIVTKTFENFPYFKENIFCDLLIEDLKICKQFLKRHLSRNINYIINANN